MLSYIIRLDDACPTMNAANWAKVENVLDTYGIQPIVGIIPDSMYSGFCWERDVLFWESTAVRYQNKGWVIAQHGCHHLYQESIKSEFVGLPYIEQKALIAKGYDILCSHNIIPTCFFAPAHAFDDVTVDVCKDLGHFRFISDGNALYQYRYRDMLFLPAIFSSVRTFLPKGIYTFVLHPNTMTDKDIESLKAFCGKHETRFVNADKLLNRIDYTRSKSISDYAITSFLMVLKRIKNRRLRDNA